MDANKVEVSRKVLEKLLDVWEREARSHVYERSSSIGKDLAKIDEAKEQWKTLLGL